MTFTQGPTVSQAMLSQYIYIYIYIYIYNIYVYTCVYISIIYIAHMFKYLNA